MRRIFPDICGNDALRARLGSGLCAEIPSVSHAYVIEGARGTGKHTLARDFAAALCCEHRTDEGYDLPCGKCSSCRKIFAGICPDVITVGRDDKASVGVDAVRALREDVHIYPNDLDRKIYIIEDADTMTVQAQNAFLLTLEEPPEYAVFLLLCENSHELLETVRSRAPVLRMQPLTPEMTAKTVLMKMPSAEQIRDRDPHTFNALTASAGGSAGRAMELLCGTRDRKEAEKTVAMREFAEKFCRICSGGGHGAEIMLHVCGDGGTTRDSAREKLETVRLALRDLTVLKRDTEAPILFFSDRESAVMLSDCYSLRRLLSLEDAVTGAITSLEKNYNVRLTLMKMLQNAGMLG